MSYDLRIIKGDDPYGDPDEGLDVAKLIAAVNSFQPFAKLGITWTNRRWNSYPAWEGLTIDLEEHEPALSDTGEVIMTSGTADACNLYVAACTFDLSSCFALALHMAQAVNAKVWDLQENRPLTISDIQRARG